MRNCTQSSSAVNTSQNRRGGATRATRPVRGPRALRGRGGAGRGFHQAAPGTAGLTASVITRRALRRPRFAESTIPPAVRIGPARRTPPRSAKALGGGPALPARGARSQAMWRLRSLLQEAAAKLAAEGGGRRRPRSLPKRRRPLRSEVHPCHAHPSQDHPNQQSP